MSIKDFGSGKDPTYKENGFAEIFLPLQALEVSSIRIDEPKIFHTQSTTAHSNNRLLSNLSYQTSVYTLPKLAILTPFCKVLSWDSSTGRLDLELDSTSVTALKCEVFQEYIINTLHQKSSWFTNGQQSLETLRTNFQHIYHNHTLTVYLHGQNQEKKVVGRVWIWKNNTWQKGAGPTSFKRGQSLRVAIRFQGICFLPGHGGVTFTRLQHQVIAIYHKSV